MYGQNQWKGASEKWKSAKTEGNVDEEIICKGPGDLCTRKRKGMWTKKLYVRVRAICVREKRKGMRAK